MKSQQGNMSRHKQTHATLMHTHIIYNDRKLVRLVEMTRKHKYIQKKY